MPFLAAALLIIFYSLNLPVTAAFVISDKGCAAAFRPVSHNAAVKAARKAARKNKKQPPEKSSRLILPLKTFETAKNLLPYITVEHFQFRAEIGLDDAAFTAILSGFLTSAAHMINCRARVPGKIAITPDFNEPRLTGEIIAAISIPVKKILRAAALAAVKSRESTPIIRTLRIYARICRLQNGHNNTTGG